ncbi:hypothetical protein GO608_000535 (plasmid) [Aromatoleum buckelii]|uniref:DUF6537 domain-containing protein n=1 Tax=Aromatoleum buckelii TaxID=200254 RepID=A0ABX1N5Z5_9RHOO|nr:DUF6537 domain-containing protein [Aromatoleum buckelii]MCK0509602.1 hypothetical protein [Aromatoleum buckelii]
MERWLAAVERDADRSPSLALELVRCGQLIKGYGDTAERGQRSMRLVLELLEQNGGDAERLAVVRVAALTDSEGRDLALALDKPVPQPRAVPVRIVRGNMARGFVPI